jgi:hypothetical protein
LSLKLIRYVKIIIFYGMSVSKIGEDRINLLIDKRLKELACKVARMRGETLSSMVRRALKRELASLGYLNNEEVKALGVASHMMKEVEKRG